MMKNYSLFKILKNLFRYFLYTIIAFLLIFFAFLAYYVISCKMAESKNVTPPFGFFMAVSESMEPTINKNDVILIRSVDIKSLKRGDIITFYPSNNIFAKTTVTHRINEIITENGDIEFITKGDANETEDIAIVENSDILGKVILIIPKLGIYQSYIAENARFIFILFIPSVIFLISVLIRGIRILRAKKEIEDIGEF